MSVFTYTPDFGASRKSKPRVNAIQFGDGYEQRVATGQNRDPKVWALRFSNRSVDDIDAIEAFLEARVTASGTHESFDWTPPRADTAITVVCREWDRTIDHAETDSLAATFIQVFEP